MFNRYHFRSWLILLISAGSLLGQSSDAQWWAATAEGNIKSPMIGPAGNLPVGAQDRVPDAVNPASSFPDTPPVFPYPTGITVDGSGNLWVSDAHTNSIHKVTPSGAITLVAGTSGTSGNADGGGAMARFNQPNAMTLLSSGGTLVVADTANGTIRSITPDGTVTTLAGSAVRRGNDDGPVGTATFSSPLALCRDASDTLYVADAMNHTIRKVTAAGVISTIAGRAGSAGFSDGTGSAARFNYPGGIAVDGEGNIYVADTTNNLIRKITSAGVVSTLAGLQNVAGYEDGTGSQALFNHPGGLAVDGSGNIFVADTDNSAIRRITPAGVVSTIAGLPTIAGLEDGAGIHALFNHPLALAVDAGGNIYVADTGNATIRRIDVNWNVTTVALAPATIPPQEPVPASSTAPSPIPSGP